MQLVYSEADALYSEADALLETESSAQERPSLPRRSLGIVGVSVFMSFLVGWRMAMESTNGMVWRAWRH